MLAVTVVALIAAGAHAMSFSAAALADQETFSADAERHVVARPPTAASDGLPVPALVGGVVLAFAVGITGGRVHQRRRTARRRNVASARPAPVVSAPARPAPEPPEAEMPAEQPVDLAVAPPAAPVPPPPEPQAAPPRVIEPPAAPAPPPPEPPRPAVEPAERPKEPLRLLAEAAVPRPHADAPLGEAPEVPRPQEPPADAVEPEIPLEQAPEAVRPPTVAEPAPVPARRFARPAPWPEDAQTLWTCEIAWKAGYRKSSFRAMAGPPGAAKRRPIADSPSVRWTLMGEPEPPTPELAIRVRALVQALEAVGWEHIGRGAAWYAQRFVWRGSSEPGEIGVPDVEPAER